MRLPSIRLLGMFAVSGLLSALIGGALLASLLLVFAGGLAGAVLAVFLAIPVAILAVEIVGLPAVLVGSLLWMGGTTQPWLRHGATWACVGAVVGGAAYLLPAPEGYQMAFEDVADEVRLIPVACLFAMAGAGAALMFRANMRVLLTLFPGRDVEDA